MLADFAEHAHARSVDEVAAHFGVSLEDGLDEVTVARQRAKHGRNELPADEGAFLSPSCCSPVHAPFSTSARGHLGQSGSQRAGTGPRATRKIERLPGMNL
jgi:hypothetical protein